MNDTLRPAGAATAAKIRADPPASRDAAAVAGLFRDSYRRDVLAFCPHGRFEEAGEAEAAQAPGPEFRHLADGPAGLSVAIFGSTYRIAPREGAGFSPHDRRMIRAIGAVYALRYHNLFHVAHPSRQDLYRGGSDDHYVAAFVEPSTYELGSNRPSRIASTIQTLRVAALSTYENRRVSTGALLLGPGGGPNPAPADALPYGVGLTALKSIHKLCDGRRTLFLVDPDGRLAEIVDVDRFAAEVPGGPACLPCARAYASHAQATREGGHVCLVLSPVGEIKVFADGAQVFAFAHGRWRNLDPASKFAAWEAAVPHPGLARALFQAALDLAEGRLGGLFVVVADPAAAVGRLIAPHDLLDHPAADGPPAELVPGDPLAQRALHYLARGRDVLGLDPSVLEGLAGIDGALAVDATGRLLTFGAILRHDAASLPGPAFAEGARTTAALVASRFGPVLKVSEDGVISCFLDGRRVWDL